MVQCGASRKSERQRSAGIGLLALLMALPAAAQTPAPIVPPAASSTATPNRPANPNAPQVTPQASVGAKPVDSEQAPSQVMSARPALTTSLWSKAGVPVVAVRFDGVTLEPN